MLIKRRQPIKWHGMVFTGVGFDILMCAPADCSQKKKTKKKKQILNEITHGARRFRKCFQSFVDQQTDTNQYSHNIKIPTHKHSEDGIKTFYAQRAHIDNDEVVLWIQFGRQRRTSTTTQIKRNICSILILCKMHEMRAI